MQTFFVEHIETPTGRMRIVTDDEQRLRAVDWDDHEPRMQDLLRRHYGAELGPVARRLAPVGGGACVAGLFRRRP